MKSKSQITILTTIVKWQAQEIEALEQRLKGRPKSSVRDFFEAHPEARQHMMEGIAKGVKREVKKYEKEQAQWSKPTPTRAIAWEECGR